MIPALLDETIAAHGGLDAWLGAAAIDVSFSARGPAFASKGRPFTLRRAQARIATAQQHVVLRVGAWPGWTARLDAAGVHLSDPAGVLRSRPRCRPWAPFWDRLDLAWFCAQAMWTYASLPFVLADQAVASTRELPGRRLEVTFAPGVHTHCQTQVLHLDSELRIVRHDYTAEAFGSWARAAQTVAGHRCYEGLLFGTERTVHPRRRDGRPRLHPILVSVRLDEVRAVPEPVPTRPEAPMPVR